MDLNRIGMSTLTSDIRSDECFQSDKSLMQARR